MPHSRRANPACCAVALVQQLVVFFFALWLGCSIGYAVGLRAPAPAPAAAPPGAFAITAPAALRGAAPAPPNGTAPGPPTLRAALAASAAVALKPLPFERIPLVRYTLRLTGHPPLVSRSDVTEDGNPDFERFGVPADIPVPSFFMADPHDGAPAGEPLPEHMAHTESPLRYVVRSEDAVRDIVLGMLASPGRVRGEGGKGPRTCKASPVTRPYACLAQLRDVRPGLFEGGGGGAPLPAEKGGPLVIDLGFTSGGFYGLLAASQGVSAMVVDSQPQCAMWAGLGAAASGSAHLLRVHAAVPVSPEAADGAASVRAHLRTGCLSTSTTDEHPAAVDTFAFYGAPAPEVSQDGREEAEAARSQVGTEGMPLTGGRDTMELPLASLDDLLCATYPAACADGGGGAPPALLLVKIDARGRELDVLAGMARVLASPALRPLNILVEVNKQHTAAVMGLSSARAAAKAAGVKFPPGVPGAEGLVAGFGLPAFDLNDAENEAVAERYVALVQLLLDEGYEVLVSDRGAWRGRAAARPILLLALSAQSAQRSPAPPPPPPFLPAGWWAAQDPWRDFNVDPSRPLSDGTTLTSWSEKLTQRNEVVRLAGSSRHPRHTNHP